MNTTVIDEQTENTLATAWLTGMRQSLIHSFRKVTNLTQEINDMGNELDKLMAEDTCTKEHTIGHTVLIEAATEKLQKAVIEFRYDFIMYRANIDA